jgi:hypothetical protein
MRSVSQRGVGTSRSQHLPLQFAGLGPGFKTTQRELLFLLPDAQGRGVF